MAKMMPNNRPQQKKEKTINILESHGIKVDRPIILGMRGYFLNTMGETGKNDRGIYDDAIILIAPDYYMTFNGNTDPSRYRKGHGTSEGSKGMAKLNCGLWTYKRGMHRGKYMALIQAGEVTVTRDGNPDYEDTGWFGINIHKGSYSTTSSEGCQTIHPDQWNEFYNTGVSQLVLMRKVITIPYLLIEQQG